MRKEINKKTTYIFKIAASFLFVGAIILFSGCGCKSTSSPNYNLTLEIWGPLDLRDALQEVITNYQLINPNISRIEYKKISADTYKKELNDALASGLGPDIFLMHNDWTPSFSGKIFPAPQTEIIINEQKFRQNFVDVSADDFLNQGQIWAVPVAVETLGLYYNKDMFNQVGITSPPADWNEFIDDVRKLTRVNEFNEIEQAGAAIGTAKNINRSTDILNLLMLQNNTEMTDQDGRVSFDKTVSSGGGNISPGEEALNFYTQFARSGSLNYTWNPRMHYSIDAFSEGKVAMMFNYSWHARTIKDKAPKLNFSIAPVPQFEDGKKANFANYWGFAVAKNKTATDQSAQNPDAIPVTNEVRAREAWNFLTYLTIKPDGTFSAASGGVGRETSADFDPAKSYLSKTGEPAARRDLIEQQKNDPMIGVFATDNLIAKSWMRIDPESIEGIFAEMIDQVNKGQFTVHEAVQTAAQRVRNLSLN